MFAWILLHGCAGTGGDEAESCGEGTHDDGGVCVPDVDTATGGGGGGGDTDGTGGGGGGGGDTDGTGGGGGGDDDSVPDDSGSGGGGDTDSGQATSWTVCADGTAPYIDIQDAIDDAVDGDVITVCPGTYDWVTIDRVDVTLEGAGADQTFVDGGAHAGLAVSDCTVTLSGMAFTGTGDETTLGAGLSFVDSTITASDLRVYDTVTGMYGGTALVQRGGAVSIDGVEADGNSGENVIGVYDGGSLVLRHASVHDNQPDTYGNTAGVLWIASDEFEISNILVYDNVGQSGAAVVVLDSPGWVYNITIADNTGYSGSVGVASSGINAQNLVVYGNPDAQGLQVMAELDLGYSDSSANATDWDGGLSGTGNIEVDPGFVDSAHGDFSLDPSFSPLIDAGNPLSGYDDPDGSPADIGAFGGPYGAWTP